MIYKQNSLIFNIFFVHQEPEKPITDEPRESDLAQTSASKAPVDEEVSLTDKKEDESKSKTSQASAPSKMEVRKIFYFNAKIFCIVRFNYFLVLILLLII